MGSHITEIPMDSSTSFRLRGAAIALSGAFALIGCLGAAFIQYDDAQHINNQAWSDRKTDWEYFIPKPGTTYMPLSFISYSADRWLHGWWTEKAFGSWAPGVRLDNLLIHAIAALFLWRLLVLLRFSETRSFFIAMMFACHPLICETVCWVSERKNCLAGMFGFAAMWVQALCFKIPTETPHRESNWAYLRWPAVCVLYSVSLLGKPSSLGLLPIMVLLECVYLFPALRARLFGAEALPNSEMPCKSKRFASGAGIVALAVISLVFLQLNLYSHTGDIVAPPGGSVFTALLTDLEIFSRYLFNLACPVGLSAMYYVEPILGLNDPRVWFYAACLAVTISATIYFAHNRWVAAFGWFWFFSALATNANVIAIAHWMQDRYIYLSAPGFWIAVSECVAGLSARYGNERSRRSLAFATIAVLSVSCAAMSASRGYVWSSMLSLSWDGTQKQPQSFFAHYGFGWSMNPRWYNAPPGSPNYKNLYGVWHEQFVTALEKCPDAERFGLKQWVAAELGKDAYAHGDAAKAEYYFKIGATKPALAPEFLDAHVISLAYLSMLDLYFKRDPELARDKGKESMRLTPSDYGRFALANANVACAQKNPHANEALLAEARKLIGEIPLSSGVRGDADALLKTMN